LPCGILSVIGAIKDEQKIIRILYSW